jgi:hypothetical protein
MNGDHLSIVLRCYPHQYFLHYLISKSITAHTLINQQLYKYTHYHLQQLK